MSADWELLDFDPATGMKKWLGYDEDSDSVLVSYDQDKRAVSAILDGNKAGQNEQNGRMGDMAKVARIPTIVMYEWLTRHGVNFWDPAHEDGVKRLLNSSDYRWLKCREIIL